MACLITLTSCNQSKNEDANTKSTKEMLCGNWKGTYSEFRSPCALTLNENGTGVLDNMGVKGNILWENSGDTLFTAPEGADIKSKEERSIAIIKSVTDSTLIYEDEIQDGMKITFNLKKVK